MGVTENILAGIAMQPGSFDDLQESKSAPISMPPSPAKSTHRQVSYASQLSSDLEAADPDLADSEFRRTVTNASIMSHVSMEIVEARWEALLSMIEAERTDRLTENQEIRDAIAELKVPPNPCEHDGLLDEFRCEIEDKLIAIGATCEDHIGKTFAQVKVPSFDNGFREELENMLAERDTKMKDHLATQFIPVDESLKNLWRITGELEANARESLAHLKHLVDKTAPLAASVPALQKSGSILPAFGRPHELEDTNACPRSTCGRSPEDFTPNAALTKCSGTTPHKHALVTGTIPRTQSPPVLLAQRAEACWSPRQSPRRFVIARSPSEVQRHTISISPRYRSALI